MPFVTDYTPISAVLQLGGIAGAGTGFAQQQAKRLQEQQLAAQIAQQNIANQLQAEQFQREMEARQQANTIQNALAYDRMVQEQNQFNAQLEQRRAEAEAQNLLSTARQAEEMRQFNERQALDVKQLGLQQQKFDTEQQRAMEQEESVNDMIDQLFPVGSVENQRMKLQFKATGRLPAPQTESEARNLNALTIARKTLTDPLGQVLPGKEQDLAAIDQQIAAILRNMGSGAPATPTPSANPLVQLTGETTPNGVPMASVTMATGTFTMPAPRTAQEHDLLPEGAVYVSSSGAIAVKG